MGEVLMKKIQHFGLS